MICEHKEKTIVGGKVKELCAMGLNECPETLDTCPEYKAPVRRIRKRGIIKTRLIQFRLGRWFFYARLIYGRRRK